jgi:hypothetical protein
MNFNSLDDFLIFRIGFPSTGPSRRLEPLGAEGQRGNVANENCLMVLVRARQRKRQSMEGFAQEDIPEGSKPNPRNREPSPGIENKKPSCTSAGLGLALVGRTLGRAKQRIAQRLARF